MTQKRRYSKTQGSPPPERVKEPLPPAAQILLGQVTRGTGRAAFRRQIAAWDWQSAADDLADSDDVAGAVVEKFLKRGAGEAIRRGVDDDYDAFRGRALELLDERLDARGAGVSDDGSFSISYDSDKGRLRLDCEVWGGAADIDNPDERANFDHGVDDAIRRLLGPRVRIAHDFKQDGWEAGFGDHRFVWRCSVDYEVDPGEFVRNSKSGAMALIRELAEKAAASACP